MPANGGVREGVRAVQHRRRVHADGHAAGPQHEPRPGQRGGRVFARGRHLPVHPRELHQRAQHGPQPRHARHARPVDAGENCSHN